MTLIANRQLTGDYGTVHAGQVFTVTDEVGLQLISNGVARRPDPPRVLYETKVIVPEAPEVSARQSLFRDLPVSDPEPKNLAPQSHRELPVADVCKPRTSHPGGRGGRARSGAGE